MIFYMTSCRDGFLSRFGLSVFFALLSLSDTSGDDSPDEPGSKTTSVIGLNNIINNNTRNPPTSM